MFAGVTTSEVVTANAMKLARKMDTIIMARMAMGRLIFIDGRVPSGLMLETSRGDLLWQHFLS
jgi:hypothetical protein